MKQVTLLEYRTSLLLNGGLATLCILMQFMPVPFVGNAETMDLLGMTVVATEVIAVAVSLRWLLTHTEHKHMTTPKMALTIALPTGGGNAVSHDPLVSLVALRPA